MNNVIMDVWKTIKIGNCSEAGQLIYSINNQNKVRVERITEYEIRPERMKIDKIEKSLDLVTLKISDLGFENLTDYKTICSKAKKFGLYTCPDEVGYQLLLQYKDEDYFFYKNYPFIAMEPKGEYDLIFRIKTDESKKQVLLTTKSAKPYYLNPSWLMIFCLKNYDITAYI
jgi:hypothetical protein